MTICSSPSTVTTTPYAAVTGKWSISTTAPGSSTIWQPIGRNCMTWPPPTKTNSNRCRPGGTNWCPSSVIPRDAVSRRTAPEKAEQEREGTLSWGCGLEDGLRPKENVEHRTSNVQRRMGGGCDNGSGEGMGREPYISHREAGMLGKEQAADGLSPRPGIRWKSGVDFGADSPVAAATPYRGGFSVHLRRTNGAHDG